MAQGLHDASPARTARCASSSMRLGIAKVDEQAIAEILGDVFLKRAITFAQVSW